MAAQQFFVGDNVFARVKGYSPWPAKILEIKHGKKFVVVFYGDKALNATVAVKDIQQPLSMTHAALKKYSNKKGYRIALEQLKEDLKTQNVDLPSWWDEIQSDNTSKRSADLSESRASTVDDDMNDVSQPGQTQLESPKETVEKTNKPDINSLPTLTLKEVIEMNYRDMPYFLGLPDPEDRKLALFYSEGPLENMSDIKGAVEQFLSASCIDAPQPVLVGRAYRGEIFGVHLCDQTRATDDNIDEWLPAAIEAAKKTCADLSDIDNVQVDTAENVIYDTEFLNKLTKMQKFTMFRTYVCKFEEMRRKQLDIEYTLVESDLEIKSMLGMESADAKKALEVLKGIQKLDITKLMLLKHVHVVTMITKLKKYVGNISSWTSMTNEERGTFIQQAKEIRDLAEQISEKFTTLFDMPTSANWPDFYNEKVEQFRFSVKDLSGQDRLGLVGQPGTKLHYWDLKNKTMIKSMTEMHGEVKQLMKQMLEFEGKEN